MAIKASVSYSLKQIILFPEDERINVYSAINGEIQDTFHANHIQSIVEFLGLSSYTTKDENGMCYLSIF